MYVNVDYWKVICLLIFFFLLRTFTFQTKKKELIGREEEEGGEGKNEASLSLSIWIYTTTDRWCKPFYGSNLDGKFAYTHIFCIRYTHKNFFRC